MALVILNFNNDLANKAGLQVNKFNGQQRVDIIVKANESLYDNAQFVSYSPNNNDSNAVAGYGFHNGGLNGCAIYLDTDDCLKKIDHEGNVEKLILENELLNLLKDKANLQGGNSFIGCQSSKNNATIEEWSNTPFLSEADASTTNARAMYGFHNAGVNAGVLYLDIDGYLKWRNNGGTQVNLVFNDQINNMNSKYFTEGNILSNRINTEDVKIKTMFILTADYCPDDSPIGSAEGFVIYIADKDNSPRQKVIVLSYSGQAIFQRDIWNGSWLNDWKEIISAATFESLQSKVNNLESKFNNLFTQSGNTLTINY